MKFATTFYRRPLPPSCTALSSVAGRKLFASAAANKGLKSFFFLVEHFLTQSEPAYCGLSTLVMVLNALSVDPRAIWKGPWRWYEESMLNCCVDMEQAKQTGITIPQFVCLAKCQGLVAEATYGSESTVDQFRDAVKLSCVESTPHDAAGDDADDDADGATEVGEKKPSDNPFLVVSYSRRVLGQTGSGHFSPVAAYDDSSDQVLILDTARFKYGPHWVPLTLLYDALLIVDPTTERSRGYVLLSHEDDHDEECPRLPQSVLFRSRMCQFDVRCRYLDFLSERETAAAENGNVDGEGGRKKPITFREVIRFWTDDGNDPEFVWEMIDPQLAPVNADEKKVVDAVLSLIDFLVERQLDEEDGGDGSTSSLTSFCRRNAARIVPIDALGAMFVVYLASLPLDIGREIVHAGSTDDGIDDETTELAREQLLAEAELIRYAIDFSNDCADVDFECDAERASACGKRCSSGDQAQCS